MIEAITTFQNDVENPTRKASIFFIENNQQYIVRMTNEMGHDFKAYFLKEDLENAKKFASSWVKE